MLLHKKGFSRRENRKETAGWKGTKRKTAVLPMTSEPDNCSSIRPSKPTHGLRIFEGREHFTSPKSQNSKMNNTDRQPYSGCVVYL